MAVGTVELARRLGISSPAISQWTIVPAERVIAVEAVTHVSRHHLRPDIYPQEG
jgi:DNA-binding transcriptional regulator YdaS (Cro superfamily)